MIRSYLISAFVALNQYWYDDDNKLGDVIIELGHQTSEEVDYRDLYPIIEAMGTVQADIVSKNGISSATYNLKENESNESLNTGIEELKKIIKDYNESDNYSLDIWETADEDYSGAQLAFTSENIRKTQASNSIGVTSKQEKFKKKIQYVMKWFGIVMSCLSIVTGVLQLISKIMLLVSGISTAWWAVSTATFTMCIVAAAAGSIMMTIGMVTMILIAVAIVVFVIWYLIYINKKTIDHTDYPNYIFDAVDQSDGSTATIRYSSVRGTNDDQNADPADVNVEKQYKWEILEETHDYYVGSPIVVTKDSNGNDITFRSILGDNSSQDGYDCVKLFGNTGPTDLNTCCEDKEKGLYLHYTTEESTGQATPADLETDTSDDTDAEDEEKNYIFFYGGHETEDTWYLSGDIVSDVSELGEKLQKDPHVGVRSSVNLAQSIHGVEYISCLHIQTYIGYTWSYNPKRAITHAYIYQGDSYSKYTTSLNYSISKTNISTGSSVGYVAATFLNQQDDVNCDYIVRYPDPSNCFRNFSGMHQSEATATWVSSG